MKNTDKIKKFVKENKTWMIAGFAVGWIGMTIWEYKHTTPEPTWDILLDKPISDAFATVKYEDGATGIIKLDSPGVMDELYFNLFPGE